MSLTKPIEIKSAKNKKQAKCKGLFFRASVTQYLSKHKSLEYKKSLRLLRRKSCKGCSQCEWIFDFLKEEIQISDNLLPDADHGEVYIPVVTGIHDDTEIHFERIPDAENV